MNAGLCDSLELVLGDVKHVQNIGMGGIMMGNHELGLLK